MPEDMVNKDVHVHEHVHVHVNGHIQISYQRVWPPGVVTSANFPWRCTIGQACVNGGVCACAIGRPPQGQ